MTKKELGQFKAIKHRCKGCGIELNSDYFRDGVGYLKVAEETGQDFSLFDLISCEIE